MTEKGGSEPDAGAGRARNFSPWEHFLANAGERHVVDPAPVDIPGELAAWRERLRTKLREILGPMPEPVPLRFDVLEVVEVDGYTRQKVVYDTERFMSVPAHLLIPAGRTSGAGPAVLAQHGHGPGKDQICGVGPHAEPDDAGDYAHQLALRGYVVLAPDLRAFGERCDAMGPPERYPCDLNFVHLALLGYNKLALDLWDVARGIDVLAAHPLVDPARIAMVGLSQGATMTLFAAALDERIACAVVSGYFSSFVQAAALPWNLCGSQVTFGMLGAFDHVDLGALIAPRPLLVQSGTADTIFPVQVAAHAWGRLQKVYRAFDATERLGFDVFDGGHRWNDGAYPFLERFL
jgi:dienelactone hydrolase